MTTIPQGQTGNDELLRAAVSGGLKAYTELFEGYRKGLCRSTSQIVNSSDEVEDVVQEIFEPVYKAIQGKDPSDLNLRAYLYKAAKNEALRVAKRSGHEEPKDADDLSFQEALSNAGLARIDEMCDEMFDKMDRDYRKERIKEALKEGDQERLDKLRDEMRKSMKEIKKHDSEDEDGG